MSYPLDGVPIAACYIIYVTLFILAMGLGTLLGKYNRRHVGLSKKTASSDMLNAILALFAFMLAFTFGSATSRFDTRKQMVLAEANMIETTYLRTDLLPKASQGQARNVLLSYAEGRLATTLPGQTQQEVLKHLDTSKKQLKVLWSQVVAISTETNHSNAGHRLYLTSVNDLIDMNAQRISIGVSNRIPRSIMMTLMALAALSMLLRGYKGGQSATKQSVFPAALLILSFSLVLLLITDLDRPMSGKRLVGVSQQAMVDLIEDIQTDH